jgi:arylamine N-acetyltransferase
MNLNAYLNRIEFVGDPRPDRATLDALMQAHLRCVPFENLDQQLGAQVSTDVQSAYKKIVEQHRGGWCFELNTLFGWALSEIGFKVDYLAGHVGRDGSARSAPADHKFLLVDCCEPLFVDVGFGGSLFRSLPMAPVKAVQPPYTIEITREDAGYYRFTETANGAPFSFDFRPVPVGADHFEAMNIKLQTDENSPFRRTLTAQTRRQDRHIVLRGRILKTIKAGGVEETVLPSGEALVSCLKQQFGIDHPDAASLWPQIAARHSELFGNSVAEDNKD